MSPEAAMIDVVSGVAADRASRTGRAAAVERDTVGWTVRDADEPTPEGWTRVTVVEPGTEDPDMGVMKRISLMKAQGQPIPKALLEMATARRPTPTDASPEPARTGPPDPGADPPDGRSVAPPAKRQGSLFE
jgi:hypothetical protein